METLRVRVSSTLSNTRLRQEFRLEHEPQWSDRDPYYAGIPADFPKTSYEVTLGLVRFGELGADTVLTPDDCISLLSRAKRVVRVATLWEQLALLDEYGATFANMLEDEHNGRPVIAWGTTGTVMRMVRCTPVLYNDEQGWKIMLPPQSDPFPFGRYANLVVVE